MTTIRAVAQEANVSPSTVSLVLNGRAGVSEQTRERVVSVMRRLGYMRQGVGRPVATVGTHQIGIIYTADVVAHRVLSELARAWIKGIRTELQQSGDYPSVFGGAGHADDDLMLQQVLEASEVEGFILIGVHANDGYLDRVLATGLPAVVLNRRPTHGEFSYVALDNYGGGRQAIEHLYAHGHRHLAMVCSMHGESSLVASRRAGAEAAADRLGLTLEPVVWGGYAEEEAPELERACRAVVEAGATGVFVTSDEVAGSCVTCWERAGVRVPEDLSVVAFDDLERRVGPHHRRLTSIAFDKQRMGHEAAAMLRSLLRSGSGLGSAGLTVATHVAEHETVAPGPCARTRSTDA